MTLFLHVNVGLYFFILIGERLIYNKVMISATQQHEAALACRCPLLLKPYLLPPHPISPDCHRTLALGALCHTSNSPRLLMFLILPKILVTVSLVLKINYQEIDIFTVFSLLD